MSDLSLLSGEERQSSFGPLGPLMTTISGLRFDSRRKVA
jgi:hypothetical protein